MKTLTLSTIGLAVAFASTAFAGPWHPAPRAATPPAKGGERAHGVAVVPHPDRPRDAKANPASEVIIHDAKTNKDERHAVIIDHRPDHIVNRDPHVRVMVRGYHAQHDWTRFHRPHGGWFSLWGITAWENVGTVTCEAANEANGALYPVSEDRDANGWDDDTVNAILDQALDDCYAEANGAACGPVTPACSFQPY